MKCNHCGLCCTDPRTQINLTIGDLHRISAYLNKKIEELFNHEVGVFPFADSDWIHYDMDIGLNLPCKFRIDGKCSIYSVRPLNCRLFPYWLLADAPEEKLNILLKEHACGYDLKNKEVYKRYKTIVGDILLNESKLFEINKKIDITKIEGYDLITEPEFSKKEAKKVELIKNKVRVKVPLQQIQKAILKNIDTIKKHNNKLDMSEKIIYAQFRQK